MSEHGRGLVPGKVGLVTGAAGGIGRGVAIKRFGEPSEVGFAVAFLCSDRAAFITGVALPVDGGYLA